MRTPQQIVAEITRDAPSARVTGGQQTHALIEVPGSGGAHAVIYPAPVGGNSIADFCDYACEAKNMGGFAEHVQERADKIRTGRGTAKVAMSTLEGTNPGDVDITMGSRGVSYPFRTMQSLIHAAVSGGREGGDGA